MGTILQWYVTCIEQNMVQSCFRKQEQRGPWPYQARHLLFYIINPDPSFLFLRGRELSKQRSLGRRSVFLARIGEENKQTDKQTKNQKKKILLPHSHQSLNKFTSYLVKDSLKLFPP